MSERLEKEIEEILRKMDLGSSRRSSPLRLRDVFARWEARIRGLLSGAGTRITPTKLMVLSLVLFGMTVFLRVALRQFSVFIGVLAIVLFFTAVLMSARQSRGIGQERRWRGQRVDLPSESPLDTLAIWLLSQWRRFRRLFR